MNNTWKVLIPAAALLVVGSVTAGVLVARRPPAPEAPAQKIRIANIGLYSNLHLLAAEDGEFRRNGLDAQIDQYDGGASTMKALLDGKDDVAVAADFVGVSQLFAGKDVVILAQLGSIDAWKLLVRKDHGIETATDLKGKTIGVSKTTYGELYLSEFLTVQGLKPEDVKIVDLPVTDMVARFEAGDLDAIVTFQPNVYQVQQKLGAQVLTWSAPDGRPTRAVAFALRSYATAHPDIIERYLRALIQTEAAERADETATQARLAKMLKYDDAYAAYLWPKFHYGVDLSQDLILDMEREARWSIANKLTDQTEVPDYRKAVWFAGLEKVRPQSVTIVR